MELCCAPVQLWCAFELSLTYLLNMDLEEFSESHPNHEITQAVLTASGPYEMKSSITNHQRKLTRRTSANRNVRNCAYMLASSWS
jgi:hypothetical protein